MLKCNKAGFVVNTKRAGKKGDWLLRVKKELPEGTENLCCQQKTTESLIPALPFVGFIRIFSYFFYMNEKILIGKYKRREDNVI